MHFHMYACLYVYCISVVSVVMRGILRADSAPVGSSDYHKQLGPEAARDSIRQLSMGTR